MEWKTEEHKQYFTLDEDSESVDIEMLPYLHPALMLMISWTNLWCYKRNIKPVWTSLIRTKEQDRKLNAKSSTHRYRAADLSVKEVHGWTDQYFGEFKTEFIEEFLSLGALAQREGELVSRPLVAHDSGSGWHIHIQCRR